MTNLEHHVTSLELSRKLKKLGVPQNGFFFWKHYMYSLSDEGEHWGLIQTHTAYGKDLLQRPGDMDYAAFLASELGAMSRFAMHTAHDSEGWRVWLWNTDEFANGFYAKTEPDARAKLLIHLIEQGIVDPATL